MDPKVAQALLQTLQQAMQIIQSAAGGDDEGDGEEMDEGDDMQMDKMSSKKKMKKKSDFMQDEEMDEEDDDEDDEDMDDSESMDDSDEMSDEEGYSDDEDDDEETMKAGESSLHDRLSKLEQHTGLKKAASTTPIVKRVDRLENEVLGEEYEGSVRDRVAQLETVTLGKAAKSSKKKRDEAPDVIPLDDLIKTAVATGIEQGLKQRRNQGQRKSNKKSNLTSIQELRKNANVSGGVQYGRRKSQPVANSSDEALTKTAQAWGVDSSDLDAPVSFGEALMTLYQADKSAGHGSFNLPEPEA